MAYTIPAQSSRAHGDLKGALRDFDTALSLEPDDYLAYLHRASILATSPVDSIRDGKKGAGSRPGKPASSTAWDYSPALDVYAAAFAENGDFEQAIAWEKKAIARLPKENSSYYLFLYQDRIREYEKNRPLRDPKFNATDVRTSSKTAGDRRTP